MEKTDVDGISQLFGIDAEIVEGSVKDGTLSVRIKDALAKKKVYDPNEFETFKKNHANEVIDSYYADLVEKSKKGDIPAELYKNIKGSALQQKERELSKEFEVPEYQNLDDLIRKAISKTTATGKKSELEQKIEELKTVNLQLVKEKENALDEVERKYRDQSLAREKRDIISHVPFDLSDKKPEEAESSRTKIQNILSSVFDSEYHLDYDDKGRLVVMDKEGKIKKNHATLEPVDPSSVMVELAKEYSLKLLSPDRGGQGGKSSQGTAPQFANYTEFEAYCKANKIDKHSRDAVKLAKTSGLLNNV